jgi:thymidine kinase
MLEIIVGPVQCGKTTELIRRLNKYQESGKRVLYINSVLDTRCSDKSFSTHNTSITDIAFSGVKLDKLSGYDISGYDVLGIDEAQFFCDLKESVVTWVDSGGKTVIVSGLDGDYRRERFGQISELLSYCDYITKLVAPCSLCKKKGESGLGIFSKRLVSSRTTVLVGGSEMYLPVCRKCF